MKKIFPILILTILFASAIKVKEIPSKLYYLDKEYVTCYYYTPPNDDIDIALSTYDHNPYDFKGESKTYEIYYDKKFTQLAVREEYIKENKQEHYQRYDKNGVLRTESFSKNKRLYGQLRSWYSNSNLKSITYYNETGKVIADSAFYSDKTLAKTYLFYNNEKYKEYNFYADGRMSDEIYYGQHDYKIALIIQYDSITRKPSMFYANDTILEDNQNPGTFILSYKLIPIDSAVIKKQ